MPTTIYFATNRNPDNVQNPAGFGDVFSTAGLGDLRFGQVEVSKGKLNPKSIKVLPDIPAQGSAALFEQLRTRMKSKSTDTLLFIHGFNVSFNAAVESAALISERYTELSNNSYQPNVFVFSWPSDGKITSYANDRHDAETSGYAFARGLMKLAEFLKSTTGDNACQQNINLIAHSMGNYVLRNTLQQAHKINNGANLARLFDNVILTAADEDNDAFDLDHKLAKLPELAQRITVYFNNGDLALKTSDYSKGNPDRLGHDGPAKPHQLPAKVVCVDVSDIHPKAPGHSYHVAENVVVRDIVAVLQGKSSDQIDNRQYVAHANKYRLISK